MNMEALLECRAMRESKEREARSGFALLGRGRGFFPSLFVEDAVGSFWSCIAIGFFRIAFSQTSGRDSMMILEAGDDSGKLWTNAKISRTKPERGKPEPFRRGTGRDIRQQSGNQ
ncbi:unnamed protein product [Sphagnum troendelagicum]|uniref:Uncharacterized protein n=1 Tax=Sphagnum troendelagicum TaxID=128251 RepID=A0ABP0TF11_9BRYO